HPSASAGLQVAMAHSSCDDSAPPSCVRLYKSATFSSPSRFFEPDGDQSAPRQSRTPAALAAITSVVAPYSQRFENGDHTTVPPWVPHSVNCCVPSAVEWMPRNSGSSRSWSRTLL